MHKTGFRHSEETRLRIRETKRKIKDRLPLVPQPCACGCGELTTVDERRYRAPKYVSGHNARIAHPSAGKPCSDATRALLASYTGPSASSYKHGWSRTPTYKSWNSMKSRCRTPSNGSWAQYGGKGIKVCDRWMNFLNFLEDMGERPGLDYQIDRRDPDGDYTPENCRWITRAENNARRKDPGGWIKRRANQGR